MHVYSFVCTCKSSRFNGSVHGYCFTCVNVFVCVHACMCVCICDLVLIYFDKLLHFFTFVGSSGLLPSSRRALSGLSSVDSNGDKNVMR